jgi:hypothetical protein
MSKKDKVKDEVQEVKTDAKEIKIALNEKDNKIEGGKELYKIIGKHKFKIIGFILGLGFVVTTIFTDFQPPQELFIGVTTSLVAGVVAYPYARLVARFFISDDRKPVISINPESPHEFSMWYVPESRLSEIEVIEGELQNVKTKERGEGKVAEDFVVKERENEKSKMYAKGTWIGSKSGWELQQNLDEIKSMKQNLEPLAMIGYAYKIKWPFIMRELSSKITNAIVHEYQGATQYKGKQMHNHVQEIIDDFSPKTLTNGNLEESDINETMENETNNANSQDLEDIDMDALQNIVGDDNA